MDHGDLRPWLECDARTGCKAFLHFNCGHFAGRAGELGEDGSVVARAAAEVQNQIAGANPEQIEVDGPEARLAVVEVLHPIEHDESVAVHVRRIGILGEPARAAALNRPWTRAHEAFARHGCEGGEDRG